MTCYYPSGAIADGLIPCNTTAGAVSSCCRVGDVCLTNGFCFSAGQNSLIRRGCTDRTFNSTLCAQGCLTGEGSNVDVVMTPCGDYTYFCCGQDNASRACCTLGNGTVLVAAGTAILPTATVTNTNAIAGSASITSCLSTSTSSASASNNSCETTNSTVPIEAGLGAALGIAIITAAGFAILWRQNAKRVRDLSRPPRPGGLMDQ
ncbi:hypothetical protein V8E51_018634 [Hyaloscypha variabilis]